MGLIKDQFWPQKESLDVILGVVAEETMYLENQHMDVIKTSLIIGIGLTLYYVRLQWPVDNEVNDRYSQEETEV